MFLDDWTCGRGQELAPNPSIFPASAHQMLHVVPLWRFGQTAVWLIILNFHIVVGRIIKCIIKWHLYYSFIFFIYIYIIYIYTYIPQWWGPNFRSDITTNVRHMMLWMPNLRSPQLWQTLNVVDWILMRLPMQLPQQEGCWKLLWWDHGGQWSLN